MNYIRIDKCDVANGEGCRVVLWVSGCSQQCPDCHNPQTWNSNAGTLFTQNTLNRLIEYLNHPYIAGITYTGGHPLENYNIDTITNISRTIRGILPNKTQWLYTGFQYEDIADLDLMKYLDVVVDGRYECDRRDVSLMFRGSSNQRIVDVPQSMKLGKTVLWEGLQT